MLKTIKAFAIILFLITGLAACGNKEVNGLSITFNKDSTAIIVSGMDQAGYFSLEDLNKKGDSLKGIVTVLETPNQRDTLFMEREMPGSISLVDNNVVFTPDTPFVKEREYVVSTLINSGVGGSRNMMKGKLNIKAATTQKTLIR